MSRVVEIRREEPRSGVLQGLESSELEVTKIGFEGLRDDGICVFFSLAGTVDCGTGPV